ncbi:MAG: hypothetical protein Q7R47_01925 [Candidatus Diapherotrites archaeon]|nr:hypothetical protein [Candidatus Diapherotrites archaeon]
MAERGFLWTTDLAFAGLLCLATLVLVFTYAANQYARQTDRLSGEYTRQTAQDIAESFLKNRNTDNPLLGACARDDALHRVLSNQLDPVLLHQITPKNRSGDFYIAAIRLEYFNRDPEIILDTPRTQNCQTIPRIVLIDNQKTILQLTICQ